MRSSSLLTATDASREPFPKAFKNQFISKQIHQKMTNFRHESYADRHRFQRLEKQKKNAGICPRLV
jgi:hypothetical protein